MRHRDSIGAASSVSKALSSGPNQIPSAERSTSTLILMAPGLLIKPLEDLEVTIALAKALGIPKCFLSLADYADEFTKSFAQELAGLLKKYQPVSI